MVSRHPGTLPEFRDFQLATLVDSVPTGSRWLHEVKYDGYRVLIAIAGTKVKIYSRSGLDWTDKFPGIAAAAATLNLGSALIDGEVVAFKQGKPNFSALQDAIANGGDMTLFAFDLLELDGEDIADLPNIQRKERLRPLIDGADARLQFAEHILGSGEQLFETMCREGYEGIVSKLVDAPYRGQRSKGWLKVKCIKRQEFVIVGWTPSEKSRGFRALLLGLNGPDGFIYAGKVGTGFDTETMLDLSAKLAKLEVKKPTVEAPRAAVRGAHWVEPKLVAEIAFAETTPDGVLRHSSFLGLREDKAAKDVVAEKPVAVDAAAVPEVHVKVSSRDRLIFPIRTSPRAISPIITRCWRPPCCPGPPTGRSASSAAPRVAPSAASSRNTTPAPSASMSIRSRSARRTGRPRTISMSRTPMAW